MALDETIATGQAGHIADHQTLAGIGNDLTSTADNGLLARDGSGGIETVGRDTYQPAVRWRSGFYFGPHGGASTTFAPGVDFVYYTPMFFPAQAIDRLGIEVTTAQAGATLELGVYEMTSAGVPGSRLLQLGSALDAGTTGGKEGVVSYTGPGDWVFLAILNDTASVQVRALTTPVLGGGSDSLTASPRGSYFEAGTTLPATASVAAGAASSIARILVRAA